MAARQRARKERDIPMQGNHSKLHIYFDEYAHYEEKYAPVLDSYAWKQWFTADWSSLDNGKEQSVDKPTVRVGQIWNTKHGCKVKITRVIGPNHYYVATESSGYSGNHAAAWYDRDLTTLVSDGPAESPEDGSPIYKVGDSVTITGTDEDGDEHSHWKTGSYGIVTDVIRDDCHESDDNHMYEINCGYNYYSQSLEATPQRELGQAKATVDITGICDIGDTFTILALCDKKVLIRKNGYGDSNGYVCWDTGSFDISPPTRPVLPVQVRYQPGDRVVCIENPNVGGGHGQGWTLGKEFTVKTTSKSCSIGSEQLLWPTDNGSGVYSAHVTLVSSNDDKLNNQEGDINMSEVSSNPVKAIMENELDADTRLLRQIGFENTDGTVASSGVTAVVQSLYAERRADFAAKYRKALATEENAAKVAADKSTKG